MKNRPRNIDSPWDTDEIYICIDKNCQYKEIEFNSQKAYVAGNLFEIRNNEILLNEKIINAFEFNNEDSTIFCINFKDMEIIGARYAGYRITSISGTDYKLNYLAIRAYDSPYPCYKISRYDCEALFVIDQYFEHFDVTLVGDVKIKEMQCFFKDGKAHGDCGVLRYNEGELDRQYLWNKLSESYNSDNFISKIAYDIWLDEGKPEGKSDWHWSQAKFTAESLLEVDYDIFCDIGLVWPHTATTSVKELLNEILKTA